MLYEGYSGSVEVREEGLLISHTKFIGGGKDPAFLRFADIGAVYFSPGGMLTNGYIQFRKSGEPELGLFAVRSDPHSIFVRLGQNDRFGELKSFVDRRIEQRFQTGVSFSVADELEKLSRLRQGGILSDLEFEEQKQRLLK